jgi:hypothetical protein
MVHDTGEPFIINERKNVKYNFYYDLKHVKQEGFDRNWLKNPLQYDMLIKGECNNDMHKIVGGTMFVNSGKGRGGVLVMKTISDKCPETDALQHVSGSRF